MKIAAFERARKRRHGLVIDDALYPLPAYTDIFKILSEESVLNRCEARLPLDSIRLLPPVQLVPINPLTAALLILL